VGLAQYYRTLLLIDRVLEYCLHLSPAGEPYSPVDSIGIKLYKCCPNGG
jgi:hypothetical protein